MVFVLRKCKNQVGFRLKRTLLPILTLTLKSKQRKIRFLCCFKTNSGKGYAAFLWQNNKTKSKILILTNNYGSGMCFINILCLKIIKLDLLENAIIYSLQIFRFVSKAMVVYAVKRVFQVRVEKRRKFALNYKCKFSYFLWYQPDFFEIGFIYL